MIGRGEMIRTSDLSVPNRAHYQAVLRPEILSAFHTRNTFKCRILQAKKPVVKSKQRENAVIVELFYKLPAFDGLSAALYRLTVLRMFLKIRPG